MENLKILKTITRLLILISLAIFSCNEAKNETSNKISSVKNIDYTKLNFEEVYSIKSITLIEEWINYAELFSYIEEINSKNYSSIIDNKKYLIRFFNGLKNTIPELINKAEIKSRLTVIETDFLKFESIISNYTIDESEKINLVKKINNSFSNLNFQIDKIIEKQEVNPIQ